MFFLHQLPNIWVLFDLVFFVISIQHDNKILSHLPLKCWIALERFQSGDGLNYKSSIRIWSFFQRENCNFLIVIFHPWRRLFLKCSEKAQNYITAVILKLLNSQSFSSSSTFSIIFCKSVGFIKVIFFPRIYDYPMRSLLGINVVPAVSRVSSIPSILNADRQIPVILICVCYILVQNI